MKAKASKLDAHAERLEEWFLGGKTLKEAQEQLRLDGCSVSMGRLSEWWAGRQAQRQQETILRQIATGAQTCREVEAEFAAHPAPELETIIRLHRVLALQFATQSSVNPEMSAMAERFTKMVLEFAKLQAKKTDQALDERRVRLLEEAAEKARKTEEVLESNISAEDQAARIREIFKKA